MWSDRGAVQVSGVTATVACRRLHSDPTPLGLGRRHMGWATEVAQRVAQLRLVLATKLADWYG